MKIYIHFWYIGVRRAKYLQFLQNKLTIFESLIKLFAIGPLMKPKKNKKFLLSLGDAFKLWEILPILGCIKSKKSEMIYLKEVI